MPVKQVHNTYIVNRKTGERHCVSDLIETDYEPADESLHQDFGQHMKYSAEQLPNKVDLRQWMTPVEHQGSSNSCTANAIAGACEYLIKKTKGEEVDVSRLFIYYNARKRSLDLAKKPIQIVDTGSAIAYAIDTLKELGVCEEGIWPFDLKAVNKKPSDDSYSAAQALTIPEALKIDIDLTEMKSCLAQGFPFAFGLVLFKTFDKAAKNGGKVPMPDTSGPGRDTHGRHAMLAVGYSENSKAFIVRNSWGDTWGEKGYCYIPYAYMTNKEWCSQVYAIKQMSDFDLGTEQWEEDDSSNLLDIPEGEEEVDDDDLDFDETDEEEEYYEDEWGEGGGEGNNEGGDGQGGEPNPEE